MNKSNCLNHFYFDSESYEESFQLEGLLNTFFRGQRPNANYITCIGAAQTFGRHCPQSYPKLLSRLIGTLCVNLGLGDASPLTFTHTALLEVINNSQYCVLQFMSARACSNYYWNQVRNLDDVYCSDVYYYDDDQLSIHDCNELWERLIQKGPDKDFPNEDVAIMELIQSTRDTYVQNFLFLIKQITVPITFLWVSKRQFNYRLKLKPLHSLYGQYPQFVTQQMVSKIVGDYPLVTCIEDFTNYYPDQKTLHKVAQLLYSQF